MARRRDSRIKAAVRLAVAATQLRNYEAAAGSRSDRVGQGPTRDKTEYGYITPFGLQLPATEVIRVFTNRRNREKMGIYVNSSSGAKIDLTQGTNRVVPVKGFKPAMITYKEDQTGTRTRKVSARTGLPYNSYDGNK